MLRPIYKEAGYRTNSPKYSEVLYFLEHCSHYWLHNCYYLKYEIVWEYYGLIKSIL